MARRDWYCEDVLSGKIDVSVVWEDARVLAFHHPLPQAEIHVVVIPKQHVPSLLDPLALDGRLLSSWSSPSRRPPRSLAWTEPGSTCGPPPPAPASRPTCTGTSWAPAYHETDAPHGELVGQSQHPTV